MLGQNFWGSRLVSGSLSVFAPPGAVPVVGGYMYPSVLRSPGVANWRSNLETVHILAILRGLLGFQP